MFSLLGQSFVNVAQVVNEPTLIIWSMSHMVIWSLSHMVNVTRRVRFSHPKSEKFLVRTAENGLIKKIRLILNFMTSQSG